MIEFKLISMTDYVSEIEDYVEQSRNNERACELMFRYKDFLKQPLTLGMFVPCDQSGNVLEDMGVVNRDHYFNEEGGNIYLYQFNRRNRKKYLEAKERVLFKGLEIFKDKYHQTERTIYNINDFRVGILFKYHSGKEEFKFQLADNNSTIEDLVKYGFELTESAIKSLGV